MKKSIAILITLGLLAGSGYAYGGRGHRLVGAIADKRLANTRSEAVRKKLKKLLDGLTLEEAATLPDNIKDWDPKKEDEIENKVKQIIVDELGVDESEVTPNARFIDDLGGDSLDTVELVMRFEEEFDIEIPDEDAEKIQSVRDAYSYINQHKKPNNPLPAREPFHVKDHPKIEAQLRAFVNANPAASKPSHLEFHYTDVPVFGNQKYADGQVGRSEFDIVHMIPFCIRVLKGQVPEKNKHAVTKAVAVILLAHYIGDIHQPLHVGAEYFDAKGKPFEPTSANPGFADQGGNKLTLSLLNNGKLSLFQFSQGKTGNLHGYWDSQTVTNAFGTTPDGQGTDDLAKSEPTNWKLTSPVANWAEMLANEIMPLAREAHDRLEFKNIKTQAGSRDIFSGDAVEKNKSGGVSYEKWAADTVKDEIHKAGWRLAALLEEALK